MQAQQATTLRRTRHPEDLSSHEIIWRDRQPFLESKGYMLRPRFRPGWTPSWLTTGKPRRYCEDSSRLPVSQKIIIMWIFFHMS